MSSVVEIANMALSRIGVSQRIDDLTEASLQAEQCTTFYEHSRDFVLRADCDWGFATAYSVLARVEVNPSPEFLYAYAVPVDCLRIRRLVNKAFPVVDFPYCYDQASVLWQRMQAQFRVINGSSNRLIATNAEEVTLEYTLKIDNPELFDPVFVSALAWKLASNIAPALSRDPGIAGSCESQYQAEIMRARTLSMNEGNVRNDFESSYIAVRD